VSSSRLLVLGRGFKEAGHDLVFFVARLFLLSTDELESTRGPEPKDQMDNQFAKCDRRTRIDLMRTTVQTIQTDKERHEIARENLIQGVEILDKIQETLASALAAYPPAALAFSGICAAAPVSLKSVPGLLGEKEHLSGRAPDLPEVMNGGISSHDASFIYQNAVHDQSSASNLR